MPIKNDKLHFFSRLLSQNSIDTLRLNVAIIYWELYTMRFS